MTLYVSGKQFEDAIGQINAEFAKLNATIAKLEDKLNAKSAEEKPNGNAKKGKSKG